jgi:hypothetical protein
VSTIQVDQSGNSFVEVGNLRVTYVPAAKRKEDKRWTDADVIRVQAYRGDPAHSKSLHKGGEFPLRGGDANALADLIAGICQLYSATH